jgi:hypothetical protein
VECFSTREGCLSIKLLWPWTVYGYRLSRSCYFTLEATAWLTS